MNKRPVMHAGTTLCLVLFLLAGPISAPAAQAAAIPPYPKAHTQNLASHPAASAAALEDGLNPDGTLNLTSGGPKSFNAAGWRMLTGPGGQPRFMRPDAQPARPNLAARRMPNLAGDEWWTSSFINGLTNGAAAANVYALAVSGSDIYVGGSFTQAGGIPANNIARWNTATDQWYALGPGVQGQVYSIVPKGTNIYVGGSFNDIGGQPAWSLAAWNASSQTWSLLGGSPGLESSGTFVGVVQAMALDSSGNLYVGGNFDHAGSLAARNIAKLSGSTWSALGNGLGVGSGEVVLSLAVSGSDVFAGGSFTSPESYIARWSGGSWGSIGGTSGPVLALTMNGSNLYAGGQFITAGGVTVNHIGLWTGGTTWQDLNGGTDNDVTSILLGPGGYFVGGNFLTAGAATVSHEAVWTGSTWYSPGSGVNGEVYALAAVGSDVYAGGAFIYATQTDSTSLPADHMARWSTAFGTWYSLGSSVDGQINAVAIDGNNVYVGGVFNSAGGVPANNVAVWNSLDGTWSNMANGVTGCTAANFCTTTVYALAVNGPNVFVGGNFTRVGGVVVANGLARWNSVTHLWTGGLTAGCLGPNCQSSVRVLLPWGSGVDAGGDFSQAGGCVPACLTVNNIVYWDGSNGYQSFTDGATVGTNGEVRAILFDGSGWYIGGLFKSPISYLEYFDGTSFYGAGVTNLNDSVYALAEDNNYLYVGGLFSNAGNNPAGNRIARLSLLGPGDWLPMGEGLNGSVEALAFSGSDLIAGGRFTGSGLTGLSHIARWSTTSQAWSAIGSGTSDDVVALAASRGLIYAGGLFLSAGAKEEDYLARWAELTTYLPVIKR